MKTKVTVIVPINEVDGSTYRCIDSILKQSVKDIEIFCIDETGLNDEMIDNYMALDIRIKKISYDYASKHSGINYAVELAKGYYLSIINPKDFLCSDMYEKMLVHSNNYMYDVIFFKYYERFPYEDGNDLPNCISKDFGAILDLGRAFTIDENPEILWGKSAIWSKLFRTEYVRDEKIVIDPYYDNYFSDMYQSNFVYSTLLRAKTIFFANEAEYCHMKKKDFCEINDDEIALLLKAFGSSLMEANKLFSKDYMVLKVFYAQYLRIFRSIKRELCANIPEKIQAILFEIHKVMDDEIIEQKFNLEDQVSFLESWSPNQIIRKRFPKILIYNWLPYDNPWGYGGGVTVYCRNIINEILESQPCTDIYFLSSGFCYDSTRLDTYIQPVNNSNEQRIHQMEIVNSPVPAEQRWLYKNPLVALESNALKEVFRSFLIKYGPFDAIHFNNIEGLSLDILDLKKEFCKTQFIYSMHNYVPLCVNGSYYMRHKHCNCNSNHTAEDCYLCTRADMRYNIAHETYLRGLHGEGNDAYISELYWIDKFHFSRLDQDIEVDRITDFTKVAIEKINKNCDKILAVSKRVYEIAVDNGFDANKIKVSYIGTKVAERQIKCASASNYKYPLKIVFLGNDLFYEEKGYPFLLDALTALPLEYAKKIDLLLTVKQPEHAQMYEQLKYFHDVKIVTGYTHKDFAWIFKECHLSVIPVLWEDNLPQIAIESVAYGVPILASSAGGASELSSNLKFRFDCGDSKDFQDKLIHFVEHPDELKEYWEGHSGLVTLKDHVRELFDIYGSTTPNNVCINSEEWKLLQKERNYLIRKLLDENDFHTKNFGNDQFHAKNEIEQLKNSLRNTEEQRNYLQYCLDETRKSKTYKLGRFMTYLPRKLRGDKL